ncbi:MFS transporter [Kribbella sp. NBC_01505]|uniref:MFS transporter n=1 Tax=Kribbella sp. NBC_01505 TaxID=2903580 RepID=UPI003865DC71
MSHRSRVDPSVSPRATLTLLVLCAGQLMIILDGSVVSVALGSIQKDLDFTPAALAWVTDAYLVAFGGFLLLAGRVGDRFGRRRVLIGGLTVFTAASVLCGLAWSGDVLIGARFVQGIGGAFTSAVVLSMIVAMHPEEQRRARAIGVFSFVAAAGASIGLLLGGLLTDLANWHWIFLINVPVGIATVALVVRLVEPDGDAPNEIGADVSGAVLITGGTMLGIYAVVSAAEHGWSSLPTVVAAVVASLLLAGFVLRQSMATAPLVPLRILRSRRLSGANLAQVLMVAGLFGFQFLGALYLQRVLGYSPALTGVAYLPVALVIALCSLGLSARLGARHGAKWVLMAGLLLVTAGLLLLARIPDSATYWIDVLAPMVLIGSGAGLGLPSIVSLAVADVPPSDSGLASGLVNTTQQLGGALGLAILVTVADVQGSQEDRGLAQHAIDALADGYRSAFLVAAALSFAALLITWLAIPAAVEPRE